MQRIYIIDPLENTPDKPWVTYGGEIDIFSLTSDHTTDSTPPSLTERVYRQENPVDADLMDAINMMAHTFSDGEESEIVSISESEPDGPTKLHFSKHEQIIFDGVAFTT